MARKMQPLANREDRIALQHEHLPANLACRACAARQCMPAQLIDDFRDVIQRREVRRALAVLAQRLKHVCRPE